MGILRVDKLSGLETPTAVTGSVAFDGNDHLSIGSAGDFNFLHNGATDWTVEFWAKTGIIDRQPIFGTGASSLQTGFYLQIMSQADGQADAPGIYASVGRGAPGVAINWGANNCLAINTWHHIAAVFKSSDKTLALYIDGREVDNDSGTNSGSFTYSSSDSSYAFTVGKNIHGGDFMNGEISNLRVVAGRRLYTSNFTPPVHALETINGTRILCCNNPDSVTAVSNTDIGNGYTVTASGDPTVATDNPGLTRDFTGGTEFNGVTSFDTQGYFVPPSGTTEQRGRGRGFFVGGNNPTYFSDIDTVQISSQGNAIRFGDLSVARAQTYGAANSTRGIVFGSYDGSSNENFLEAFDTTTGADAIDFGNLLSSTARRGVLGMASNTRAIAAGGNTPGRDNTIQYVTIASLGDAQEFGDLIADSSHASAATACSPTRGVMGGGTKLVSGSTNSIGYITMATTGNSVDFGDALSTAAGPSGVVSSSTRGVFFHSTPTAIEFITISSLGNAQEFGDLGTGTGGAAAVTNSVRGLNAGAYVSPANVNTITFVNIASTGDGTDFGDLIRIISSVGGYSDSHGGIS
tara:strand:+ start:539 stop:2266 length:1728 start_codon:yes stop_codon:yes gene_type:complete